MIVIDTSAVVAIFRQESDAARHADRISDDADPVMSAASLVEASIVLRGLKIGAPARAERWLDEFIEAGGIRVEAVTAEQARLARSAYARFGRGTGHGAALNYGDCFSYALARSLNVPLLFKGDDFTRTDIEPALRPSPGDDA